jgi:hypothetical protein
MPTDDIIVLARSKKIGGICLAGIAPTTGQWIRPISGLDAGQLMRGHCEVAGRLPQHLDVVRFDHTGPTSDPAQPENVRITGSDWELVETIAPGNGYNTLSPYIVAGPLLLGNRGRAVDDAVAQQGIEASLALIEPDSLELCLRTGYNRDSPRAQFSLDGAPYDLPISEFEVGPALRRAGLGTHSFSDIGFDEPGRVLLTISLGEPLQDSTERWKLVAAVIRLP